MNSTASVKQIEAIAVEPYFGTTKLARVNKQSRLREYQQQVDAGEYQDERYQIRWEVKMNQAQYNQFTNGELLTDLEWLAGKGGCDTTT